MEKQKIQIAGSLKKAAAMLFMALGFSVMASAQQTLVTKGPQQIGASGSYVDYTVPGGFKTLYLEARGGDGGQAITADLAWSQKVGRGAMVRGWVRIGNNVNEIPVGSTIRFITGRQGSTSKKDGGGGGGGTAVAFRKPKENNWHLLMVAGGGGGAGVGGDGREAQAGEGGANGKKKYGSKLHNGGTNGQAGGSRVFSYGGGGAYSSASGECGGSAGFDAKGVPTGGAVDCDPSNYGFGFGGGGRSSDANHAGGGGGGYSGGGAGYGEEDGRGGGAGGGGSYVDETFFYFQEKKANGTVSNPEDGYLKYELKAEFSTKIYAANLENKCVSLKEVTTPTNGTNILLWPCKDSYVYQQWIFDGPQLRYKGDLTKCLDRSKNNAGTGTTINIQLGECNGGEGQQWIYDGVSKHIRYRNNWNKCLDRKYANIRIWDCKDGSSQQWQVDDAAWKAGGEASGAKTVYPYPTVKHNKCLGIRGSYASSNNCSGRKDQQWLFDGVNIKYAAKQNKCLRLENGNTNNYTHIRIWDCDRNDKAQRWVYDGFTGTIRYWENKKKCMAINGTYVSIMDCDGSPMQQWGIKDANSN